MKFIDLTVVIPTLNEEHYIGKLLDSIASQTVLPKEIVVVDAFSKDKTIEQIKKRQKVLPQLKYYQIPKFTISRQRNLGVKKTSSPHILFLDADGELLDKRTLEVYFKEVKDKNPDMAAAFNYPSSNYWKDKYYFKAMNLLFRLSKPIWPIALGMNLYIKRSFFKRVNGFDEKVRIGEDMELVQRVIKKRGLFLYLSKPKIYTSVRRLETEGRRRFILKMIKSFMHVRRRGFRENPTDYQFGYFGKGR